MPSRSAIGAARASERSPKKRLVSTPTVSVLVYGLYLGALGIVYMVVPNVPLRLFGFEPTSEPWIRVMAAMVVSFSASS